MKSALSIVIVTAARFLALTPSDVIEPTLAPAMRTSSPLAAYDASSKIARTV